MKKAITSVLSFTAFAAFSALIAADASVTYVPTSGDGPWNWGTTNFWRLKNSPYTAIGRLPYTNPNYADLVYLFAEPLSRQPLRIPSGTVALCKQMFIGSGENTIDGVAPATDPILVELCGGIVTNYYASYLGYYNSKPPKTRSAKIDITSGKWISLGDFNFGGGGVFSLLNIGEDGLLSVPVAGKYLNLGFANHGGAIVTNKGVISVQNLRMGCDNYGVDADKNFNTGIVVNVGTISVATNLNMGSGVSSYAMLENHGTVNADYDLFIGQASGAVSEFVNYGVLNLKRRMRVGYANGAKMSVYRHMKGATLNKNIFSSDSYSALYVGTYSPGLLSVDGGDLDLPSSANQNRVFVAEESRSLGIFEVKNGGTFHFGGTAFTLGFGNSSTGILHIAGRGSKMYGDGWINAGNWWSYSDKLTRGVGEITVSDGGELDVSAVYLGFGGLAQGFMTVTNGATARIRAELAIGQINAGSQGGATGTVVVAGTDSAVTNVNFTYIGRASCNNFGLLKMEGGKYFFKTESNSEFNLGLDGDSSTGEIRGWGRISHNGLTDGQTMPSNKIYMKHYGKVIADGEGVERDLDMRFMWSVDPALSNSVLNAVGCNGWYARNKGRLLMPILYHYSERGFKKCIGEQEKYPGDPRLVNSLKITFADMYSSLHSLWAYLYAPDRTDIPAGLSSRVGSGKALAVYRIGYFSDRYNIGEPTTPERWTTAKIKFHYDPFEASAYPRVRVFRHDGTAGGSWKRIASTETSTSSPFVETEEFSRITDEPPSGAIWNVGWFAVVADAPRGAIFIVK